jgi:hypothetical protein
MQEVADKTVRQQIAKLAQEVLDRHQPRNYKIYVDPDAILEEDDWYHIVVRTDGDQRDREFYDALSEAEDELRDKNGHQYLLVPVVGD